MGRLLKMRSGQALLIARGFSICGAAAVAGVEGDTDTDEEEVVTAVALVVIFGTLMIPLIPFAGQMLGLDAHTNGLWAGGSIHEIAQVVAAGAIIGGGALGVAVIVKLARVLMLAPIVAILSVRQRRPGHATADGKKPPLVPLFIIGFLLMVILRSTLPLPTAVLDLGHLLPTAPLPAEPSRPVPGRLGRGRGLTAASVVHVGARPVGPAAGAAVLVASIALAGGQVSGAVACRLAADADDRSGHPPPRRLQGQLS